MRPPCGRVCHRNQTEGRNTNLSDHGETKTMAAEILGPVTLAKKSGARYIIFMKDLLRKYAITVALEDLTFITIAKATRDERIRKFRAPDVSHTDQGSNFNRELLNNFRVFFFLRKRELHHNSPIKMGMLRHSLDSLPLQFQKMRPKTPRKRFLFASPYFLCIKPLYT